MPWISALICKILLVGHTEEALINITDGVAGRSWQDVHDAEDGSMHVGKRVEIPADDWDTFMARSHFFITHPATFELPFYLLYPRERVNPPCNYCHGSGQIKPEDIPKDGC